MVQAVADAFGDDGPRRDARELLIEPGFEGQHERLALCPGARYGARRLICRGSFSLRTASTSRSDARLLPASLTIATFTFSISCAMLRDDVLDAAPRLMRS